MIKIYVSPSCMSCRKVKKWFKEQNIPFVEKNILSGKLSIEDLKEILQKSLDGTEEIISERSKVMMQNDIDINNMSIQELYDFVLKHPTVLKRPIIVDDHKIQVGYNEEEIRSFIPEARRIAERYCCKGECPECKCCEYQLNSEEENECCSNKCLEEKVEIK